MRTDGDVAESRARLKRDVAHKHGVEDLGAARPSNCDGAARGRLVADESGVGDVADVQHVDEEAAEAGAGGLDAFADRATVDDVHVPQAHVIGPEEDRR